MPEKHLEAMNEPGWHTHATLEAENKRIKEAEQLKKKELAAQARRESTARARQERAQAEALRREREERIAQRRERFDEMKTLAFEDGEGDDLPSRRGRRRAVHERHTNKVDLVTGGSRMVGVNRLGNITRRNQNSNEDEQRYIQQLSADIKRNARRGESIRDLQEIPPEERSKDFINAMDEISSEISDRRTDDAHGSGSSSREESAQRRMKKKPSHADREDGQAFQGRSQGRETIRQVPRNQSRGSQEQGRSLHQDPVIRQKTSERFTQQDKRRREERRLTWRSLLEGIQGFFRR